MYIDNKIEENTFKGELKSMLKDFIDKLDDIDKDYKIKIKNAIGDNWHDERLIMPKILFESAYKFKLYYWNKNNFELSKLWKEIAINSSKLNDNPSKIADETIKKYCEVFKINNENIDVNLIDIKNE